MSFTIRVGVMNRLETAAKIFYTQGIHSVPVDDVIVAAEVSRATFYRHFPGKEDLVRTYLEAEHDRIRGRVAAAAEQTPEPSKMLEILVLGIGIGIGEEVCAPGFRGCPFINAAVEYPDPEHPVRKVVREHRTWFRDSIAEIVGATGHPDPGAAARQLTLLRDGAMVGGYLEDAGEVRESLAHAARSILSSGAPPAS